MSSILELTALELGRKIKAGEIRPQRRFWNRLAAPKTGSMPM